MHALSKHHYRKVTGEHYGTPKEIWGFRTAAHAGRPERIARLFLRANAALFGLHPRLADLRHQRTLHSLGASHVIFQQHLFHRRVHRAYVTVHVDRDGRVYLAKNRAMPESLCPHDPDIRINERDGILRARRSLRGRTRAILHRTELMWYPVKHRLHPAWKIRLGHRAEEWIVFVDALNGRILRRYDNAADATGRGRIFDPNPATALGGAELLIGPKLEPISPPDHTYRTVTLRDLEGNGRLDGKRVTTAATKGRMRVRRKSHEFLFGHRERGFEEVMVYYHIDAAIRYLEQLGYRGRKAIFREPIVADVNGTHADNSWYSPHKRQITFGTGYVDDAEDAETILHELGHAIQDAICPDFGQSEEAAAMGEGFGDYFAASFFADRKPPRYQPTIMSWNGLPDGLAAGTNPPCVRRLDEPLTYANFVVKGDEHDNGMIWSAVLWDIRCALGQDVADRIIIESHFQLDGFTTFARGARAIVDADQNLLAGQHVDELRRIFRKRKIQPV